MVTLQKTCTTLGILFLVNSIVLSLPQEREFLKKRVAFSHFADDFKISSEASENSEEFPPIKFGRAIPHTAWSTEETESSQEEKRRGHSDEKENVNKDRWTLSSLLQVALNFVNKWRGGNAFPLTGKSKKETVNSEERTDNEDSYLLSLKDWMEGNKYFQNGFSSLSHLTRGSRIEDYDRKNYRKKYRRKPLRKLKPSKHKLQFFKSNSENIESSRSEQNDLKNNLPTVKRKSHDVSNRNQGFAKVKSNKNSLKFPYNHETEPNKIEGKSLMSSKKNDKQTDNLKNNKNEVTLKKDKEILLENSKDKHKLNNKKTTKRTEDLISESGKGSIEKSETLAKNYMSKPVGKHKVGAKLKHSLTTNTFDSTLNRLNSKKDLQEQSETNIKSKNSTTMDSKVIINISKLNEAVPINHNKSKLFETAKPHLLINKLLLQEELKNGTLNNDQKLLQNTSLLITESNTRKLVSNPLIKPLQSSVKDVQIHDFKRTKASVDNSNRLALHKNVTKDNSNKRKNLEFSAKPQMNNNVLRISDQSIIPKSISETISLLNTSSNELPSRNTLKQNSKNFPLKDEKKEKASFISTTSTQFQKGKTLNKKTSNFNESDIISIVTMPSSDFPTRSNLNYKLNEMEELVQHIKISHPTTKPLKKPSFKIQKKNLSDSQANLTSRYSSKESNLQNFEENQSSLEIKAPFTIYQENLRGSKSVHGEDFPPLPNQSRASSRLRKKSKTSKKSKQSLISNEKKDHNENITSVPFTLDDEEKDKNFDELHFHNKKYARFPHWRKGHTRCPRRKKIKKTKNAKRFKIKKLKKDLNSNNSFPKNPLNENMEKVNFSLDDTIKIRTQDQINFQNKEHIHSPHKHKGVNKRRQRKKFKTTKKIKRINMKKPNKDSLKHGKLNLENQYAKNTKNVHSSLENLGKNKILNKSHSPKQEFIFPQINSMNEKRKSNENDSGISHLFENVSSLNERMVEYPEKESLTHKEKVKVHKSNSENDNLSLFGDANSFKNLSEHQNKVNACSPLFPCNSSVTAATKKKSKLPEIDPIKSNSDLKRSESEIIQQSSGNLPQEKYDTFLQYLYKHSNNSFFQALRKE